MIGRRIVAAGALFVLTASVVVACSERTNSAVVVTTNILGDITREIAGDQTQVSVLMRPGADPHSFAISARQAAELGGADLIVANGLGLEEGVARNVAAARSDGAPVLEVGETIEPLSTQTDPSRPDPHFWTDPDRVITVTAAIADALKRNVATVDHDVIDANAARYTRSLVELRSMMETSFGSIPASARKLVTNHHVFGYLADRFGFDVVGAVIPSGTTLASPSASDMASLAEAIRTTGVRAIFADSSQPDRLAQVLAEQTGLETTVVPLFTESLSPPGLEADTYLSMMRTNTSRMTTGLTGGSGQ